MPDVPDVDVSLGLTTNDVIYLKQHSSGLGIERNGELVDLSGFVYTVYNENADHTPCTYDTKDPTVAFGQNLQGDYSAILLPNSNIMAPIQEPQIISNPNHFVQKSGQDIAEAVLDVGTTQQKLMVGEPICSVSNAISHNTEAKTTSALMPQVIRLVNSEVSSQQKLVFTELGTCLEIVGEAGQLNVPVQVMQETGTTNSPNIYFLSMSVENADTGNTEHQAQEESFQEPQRASTPNISPGGVPPLNESIIASNIAQNMLISRRSRVSDDKKASVCECI